MTNSSLKYSQYIVLLILITAVFQIANGQKTQIENGTLDLSKYDFNKNPAVELNGIWEFYPGVFLKPGADSTFSKHKKMLVQVPKLWDNTVFPETKKPNIGFGTYKLNIVLPDKNNELALRLKRIESSYALFVNDSLIIQVGTPGNSIQTAVPSQKTCTRFFSVRSDKITILIHVANFQHRKGGIDDPILLGQPKQITAASDKAKNYDYFMIGVLLIMAVFYFGLWLFDSKKYAYLFFSLMLTSEIISLSVNGEVMLTYIFSDLPWALLKKTDYISNFMRITFLSWFFYNLYSKEISKLYVKILTILNIILTLTVLFSNLQFYSFTLLVFIITVTITIIYVILAQIKSIVNKRKGALIPFIGTIVVFITAVNDILFVEDIIQTTYLTPFGLFIFIFAQSYLLSFEFSNLYKTEDELNTLITETDHTKNLLLDIKGFDTGEVLNILNLKTIASHSILFISVNEQLSAQAEFPVNKSTNNIIYYKDFVNEAFNSKKPVFSNNFNNEESSLKHVKSLLCCPLMKGEKIAGILYLENYEKRNAFTNQTVEFINNLSDQIIGLHENHSIFKSLENINLNLEDIINKRTKDISNQKDLLEEQKDEIDAINNLLRKNLREISEKNSLIKENINFAKAIQDNNLPSEAFLNDLFPENFILYKPKEIIGGDFYWAKKTVSQENNDLLFFAVADCTGHGVPGTLMSLIGNSLLNNVLTKKVIKPSEILDNIQKNINHIFESDSEQDTLKDGMEMGIICYDKKNALLEYAGAKIDLLHYSAGKLNEIKSDRISLGAGQKIDILEKTFHNIQINIKKDDIIYLFSDGFQDQFGGEADTKFMKANFRTLLEETASLPMNIQRSRLLKVLNRWQGDKIQNDDILVAGIKF